MGRQILILACIVSVTLAAMPVLKVTECSQPNNWNTTAHIDSFTLDVGYGSPLQQTEVHVCYDADYIYVRYDNVDNNIYSQFTTCNSDLFYEDVVEMFIAPAKNYEDNENDNPVYEYIEMEASPNGVLFVSNITNYSGDCGNFSGSLIPCAESGVTVTAQRFDAEDRWWAIIQVPFTLLANLPPYPSTKDHPNTKINSNTNTFRANFFRIDQPLNQNKEYSCWSSTFASPACFHKPAYFGTLVLV